MTIHKSLYTVPALALILISGVTITSSIVAPSLVHAAKPLSFGKQVKVTKDKHLSPEKRFKVRMSEERRIAKKNNLYSKQNKKLLEYYRKLIKHYGKQTTLVKKKGGNSTPLLKAVAHILEKNDP